MKEVVVSSTSSLINDLKSFTVDVSGFRVHAAMHNQQGFDELVALVRKELARELRVIDTPVEAA